MRLQAYQRPSRLELLLDSLVIAQKWVHVGADRIGDRSELPSVLQKLAMTAVKGEGTWRAWVAHDGIRLFVTEMSLDLSRERGCPVLKVTSYEDRGRLLNFSLWVQLADGAWHRCAL
jgi:hypothetical protein